MTIEEVKSYFLSKPGAIEETPFHIPVPVFKVGNKMFALISLHEPDKISINLKYPKEKILDLRLAFQEIQPGYHMHKDHWNTVYLDGHLDDEFIKELIDISYDLVFKSLTKKTREEING